MNVCWVGNSVNFGIALLNNFCVDNFSMLYLATHLSIFLCVVEISVLLVFPVAVESEPISVV